MQLLVEVVEFFRTVYSILELIVPGCRIWADFLLLGLSDF